VLKLAGVGGALVAGGGWAYHWLWRLTPPGPGLVLFSTDELELAEAVGEAFFPGPPVSPLSAKEIALARFADSYVGGMYESEHRLFKLLFRVLDLNALFTHARHFPALAVAQRKSLLDAWWHSRLATRRAGYQSLRYVFSMGYFEDHRVRKALGLRFGCDLSSRFPEMFGEEGAR
jgi:hypothetical protein